MPSVRFIVNGCDVTAEGEHSLVQVLRDQLDLTGTVIGCGWGECGACSVLVDSERVTSCTTSAAAVAGRTVTTVEGLARDDEMHPMQCAFLDGRALQCGYCTPGMLIAAIAAAQRQGPLDADTARAAISENFCRCTGYATIVHAIVDGSERMCGDVPQ